MTLEVQKFCGSMFLAWDRELYCQQSDESARCNTSDLNEELGQIEILFSDKEKTNIDIHVNSNIKSRLRT